jgi:hypothetical protein
VTYGVARRVGCILSLGTGIPLDSKFSSGVAPVADVIQMLTNSERAHNTVGPFSTYMPLLGQEKYWRLNLSKALSDHDTVTKIIKEKGWFGLKETDKEVQVGYDQLMTAMDDWASIPLIRELTDLWLARESDSLNSCARRLCEKVK